MNIQDQLYSKQIRNLEACEIATWRSMLDSASLEIAKQYGLKTKSIGSAFLTIVSKAEVLAFNRVIGLGLDGAVDGAEIDEIINRFRGSGVKRFFIQLTPDTLETSLPNLLQSKGFHHYNNWARFYRDTEPVSNVKTDLRIEKIGTERAGRFAELVGNAFDWPVILRPWIAASVDSLGWNHYMAFDGETAVATAAFFISGDQTWFGMASTLPEYRKQGAQGGLIERRLRDVNALGCKQIVVETAEETPTHEAPSYRNMHRYGFHLAYLKQNHIWNPD